MATAATTTRAATTAIRRSNQKNFFLTKSLFLKALECPRKLFYALSPDYYDNDEVQSLSSSSFLRNLATTGLKVGAYSRLLFPQGIEIGMGRAGSTTAKTCTTNNISNVKNNADITHSDELVQETDRLLNNINNNNNTVTLFEAAIRSGPFFIRPDILQQTIITPNQQQQQHRHLHLFEVKAKAWDSSVDRDEWMRTKKGSIQAAYLPYLQDVAFQKFVLEQAYLDNNNNNDNKCKTTISASLVMPDKAAVNTQIPNLNSRFRVISEEEEEEGKKKKNSDVVVLDEADRQFILERMEMTDERLVTVVDVDDLVDEILDSPLQFPGSSNSSSSSSTDNFRTVVQQWGRQVQLWQVEATNGRKGEEEENSNNGLLESMLFSPPPIGAQCKDCHYSRHVPNTKSNHHHDEMMLSGRELCWQQAAGLYPCQQQQNDLIIDLYHGNPKTIAKLMAAGKFLMSDIEPTDLGLTADGVDEKKKDRGLSHKEKQWHQVSNTQHPVLAVDYLQAEMEAWNYPYHFIDFETIAPALPYSINQSPFATLAFQFSHHIMERDGSVEHVNEFLFVEPGKCPNRWFLEALSDSLGVCEKGTVFRWGAHENTILTALLRSEQDASYPVVESLLTGGSRAMVDLMRVLDKGYYAPGSGASSSIKKLLLPTMRASGRLKEIYGQPTYSGRNFTNMQWWVESPSETGAPSDPYTLLATFDASSGSSVGVAQGGDAITAFELLQDEDLDSEARLALKASLLRYCELDTLAMAMIMQGIDDILRQSE